MSTLAISGARVVSGTITIPYYGPWTADMVMAGAEPLPVSVTLVAGDLSMVGTVIRQSSFSGSTTARIVGGAGGWRNEIPAKGYSHAAGVKLSTVLTDAARAVGESIMLTSDRTIGISWSRERAKAERTLHLLTDGSWWIDVNGITRTDPRDSASIVTPFTVISRSGSRGSFEIATEALSAWQPGRTFATSTVPTMQTISSVTFEAGNDGKLRLHVLNTEGAVERLRTDMRSLIRAEVPSLSYSGVWEYTIASATSTTVDAVPTDIRMPPVANCPMMPGLIGEVVTPTPGSKCRIVFVNGDPSRAECIGIDGPPSLAKLGGGVDFVALSALVSAQLTGIAAALAAHVHSGVTTGVGVTGPAAPIYTPGSVASTIVKVT